MKKFLATSIIALSCTQMFCLATDLEYPNKVKPVYLDEAKTKVVGKLLPTNGVEILGNKDGLIKFKISGYQNPKSPNVIYFKDGVRILSLAFAKTAKPNFEIIKKGEGDKWNEVSTVAYTTDGDFEKDVQPMFDKAAKAYQENCSICHSLHDVNQYSANQWPALFNSMVARTAIPKDEIWSVIEYLQKHTNN